MSKVNNHDPQYSSWFHQFISYIIWYLILNILFIVVSYPLTEMEKPSKLRIILFLIIGFYFWGTLLGIIDLLARRIGFIKIFPTYNPFVVTNKLYNLYILQISIIKILA